MKKKTLYNKSDKSLKRANHLLTMAFNSEGTERNTLARKALNANHDYVDAYIFLGDEAANTLDREQWYRMAVAAGRRVLGEDFLNEHEGEFWQIPKTRPFMDGLQGLADELLYQNREEEALLYYLELLRLNANDDQGARYAAFRIYAGRGLYQEGRELLQRFSNDTSPSWLYNDVLLTFLESGATDDAMAKLDKALISNSLICDLLLNPPDSINIEQFDLGLVYEEADSFDYVISTAHLWTEESGILDWMNKIYGEKTNRKLKPPRAREKAMLLAAEGRTLLDKGDLLGAEKLLRLALEYQDDLFVRNDLGYCKLLLEKFQESLTMLHPCLNGPTLNPFGNTLAAEAAYHLGDELNTRRFLKQAIDQFEQGSKDPFFQDLPSSWYHLTIIIKDLAGLFGNHRLVISLYHRWKQYCILDEDLFQVGVAYFNLGNYQAAIDYWKKIDNQEAWLLLEDYILAAEAFEKENLPPLQIEYFTPFHLVATYQISQDPIYEMIGELGAVKLLVIAKLFEQSGKDEEKRTHYVQVLSSLGKWGIAFSQAVLNSPQMPYSWKMATIFSLVSKGCYGYGDIISLVVNGFQENVKVDEELFNDFSFSDQPDLQRLSQILSLFQEKKYQEIIELAERDACFGEEHYLIMHILAVAHYYLGNGEATYNIVDWFFAGFIQGKEQVKDDLLILNAGVWSLLGVEERSMYCLDKLDEHELSSELLGLYELLME